MTAATSPYFSRIDVTLLRQKVSVPGILAGTVNSTFRVDLSIVDGASVEGETILLVADFQQPVEPNDFVIEEEIMTVNNPGVRI